jgi:methylglyoxal synthase
MNIAIIAHDNKKADMVAFVLKRIDFFKNPKIKIVSTGTTGNHIIHAGVPNVECVQSGPKGGDAQIASRLVEGKIDAILFFIDPLFSHPHEVDIHMLMRLSNVYEVPLATNYSTAKMVVESLNKTIIQTNKK